MTPANPRLLIWARQKAGLSKEEACRKLGIHTTQLKVDVERLSDFESGEEQPSLAILEKMSNVYARNILLFYLPEPPKPQSGVVDFRNLPKEFSKRNNGIVNTLIREIFVKQLLIKAGIEELEEEKVCDFVGAYSISDGIDHVSGELLRILNLNIDDYRKQNNSESAFNLLRSKAENAGIFVLLLGNIGNYFTDIEVDYFRGFCLADLIAPMIVINNCDAKPAWSFTLLHEMTHLMLGETAISGQNLENQTEQFCNDVASQILFPMEPKLIYKEFDLTSFESIETSIGRFATSNKISHSLIAYKLFRNGFIDYKIWKRLSDNYRIFWKHSQRLAHQQSKGGPGYSLQRYKLGKYYIGIAKSFIENGVISTTKASRLLGVGNNRIEAFLYK